MVGGLRAAGGRAIDYFEVDLEVDSEVILKAGRGGDGVLCRAVRETVVVKIGTVPRCRLP